MTRTPPVPAASLTNVKLQYKAWRDTRKQKSRIPDELWTAAVSLSDRHSVHHISRALHINHTALRDRVSACKENKINSPVRKGMFTTGIVSINDTRKIVLFISGRKHAGEDLGEVLSQRDKSLQMPLQMCDALSRNTSNEFNTILAYCLVHARRRFVDAAVNFPEECGFVIDTLAEVYAYFSFQKPY